MRWFEIERKFLVWCLPDNLRNYKHEEIRQWYFVLKENIEERIRHRWDKYYYTKKIWHWEVRKEYETEISKKKFEKLRPKTFWKRIYKTRYIIPYWNFYIELDVYRKNLEWLIVAEIEFNSKEESKSFQLPERFWEEITNKDKYKNKNLIFKTFNEI